MFLPWLQLVGVSMSVAVGLAWEGSAPKNQPSQATSAIVDKPIAYDKERQQLTIEYRRIHQDPTSNSVEIEPKLIVLHYTAGNSAKGTWRYFNKTKMEGARAKLAKAGRVNVSAHFLVDRDGTIYRLVKENWMARHTIGLNHLAIGVENVGDGKKYPLTEAQVKSNIALVRELVSRHKISHLIGHHESSRMEKHEYWLELDPKYRNKKPDPGAAFMKKVRAGLGDLALEGPPD